RLLTPPRSTLFPYTTLFRSGVYDVGKEMVSIIAYSGPGAPAYPTFPISKGLTGSVIREKATVVVADVRKDSRYLTAYGSTLAEIDRKSTRLNSSHVAISYAV